jgi:hypothetical protein
MTPGMAAPDPDEEAGTKTNIVTSIGSTGEATVAFVNSIVEKSA